MTEIPTYCIREYLNHCEQAGARKLLLGALPKTAQKKMRNTSWERAGKEVIAIQQQRAYPMCVLQLMWNTKLANGGLRYLAKETFKQSTEDIAWILTVYSKM